MGLNNYEKFEIIEIDRSDIHFADYNPRLINKEAEKKLRENIKNVGLIAPIVWNKITGNIVSGHQRVKQLDKLHKGTDYKLKVAMVELDEKTEKEQNLFMNNPNTQGEFEFSMLGEMFKSGIDVIASGFDNAEIHKLFGNSIDVDTEEDLKELANKVRELDECLESSKKKSLGDNDQNFYLVVVFKSYEERKEFTDKNDIEDNMYVSSSKIEELISPSIE